MKIEPNSQLSPHWLAHAWKALAQQHHRDLLPLLRPLVPATGS